MGSCYSCVEMLSGGFEDAIQPLPAFSSLSVPSTTAGYCASVSSVVSTTSSSISTCQQPPSRHVAASAGRQSCLTSNSLSAGGTPYSGVVCRSSAVVSGNHATSNAATTEQLEEDRDQVDYSLLTHTSSTKDGSNQEGMVIKGKDSMSSKRASLKTLGSTEPTKSVPADQINDTTTTSLDNHQRPSLSSHYSLSTPHRSALANSGAVSSTSGPDGAGSTTTETTRESSLPSSTQSSKAAVKVSQNITGSDEKSVSIIQ